MEPELESEPVSQTENVDPKRITSPDEEKPPVTGLEKGDNATATTTIVLPDRPADSLQLLYSIDESPPWPLAMLLGFQHYLTSFASTLTIPLILADHLCVGGDRVGLSQIFATYYFASGIATLLQTTIGIRLPIIQGSTMAFLAPAVAILNLPQWKCPHSAIDSGLFNSSLGSLSSNQSVINDREEWQMRMREIQGAISVACLIQVILGVTGLMSVVIRYVGPLTVTPTITLIGISLFRVVAVKASSHWWIAITTLSLIALFSQYLSHMTIPMPPFKDQKGKTIRLPLFKLFPIFLALTISWLLCFVLTVSGVLSDNPDEWGYKARTDTAYDVIRDSPWIRIPYPGQWGLPTFNTGAMLGMMCGVFASVIESIGDYYACARFAGAEPPPPSAINRGIAVEGLGGIVAGILGTGNATTSYGDNIASMTITKVGSLRVGQCAGLFLILVGCVGKMGAVFISIPDPVMGGLFLGMYGMLIAVGLSNLQYVDMSSGRNLFTIGMSFFIGLVIPEWVGTHKDSMATGVQALDEIFLVLLSSNMFVGGVVGFFLDNTLPGTLMERGFTAWRSSQSTRRKQARSTYELPFISQWLRHRKWARYVPIFTFYDDVNLEKNDKSLL